MSTVWNTWRPLWLEQKENLQLFSKSLAVIAPFEKVHHVCPFLLCKTSQLLQAEPSSSAFESLALASAP